MFDEKKVHPAVLTKEMLYRNSKTWYAESDEGAAMISQAHIDFCRKYAGNKILDFGCATGNYIVELKKLGFSCVGVDVNERYIELASKKGIEAHVINDKLPFDDKTFDTVIMFELLEHVQEPEKILEEAKRVARKNILITVPNCTDFESLRRHRLTYEHLLELDHVNFFTKQSLAALLSCYFEHFTIIETGKVYPWLFDTQSFPKNMVSILLRKIVSLMVRMKLLMPKYSVCLFAVVRLD